MYRWFVVAAAVLAFAAWTAGPVLAQAGGDYQLPPVKLKPDRPTTAKPIPPTPDDRTPAPPAEKPPEPPPPTEPPTPPAPPPTPPTPPEPTPPTPPTPPPMPPVTPPAPPVAPPAEKPPVTPPAPPTMPLVPPTEKPPEMPPAEKPLQPFRLTPPAVEKPLPILTPAKPPAPVETPLEAAPIAKPLKTAPATEAGLPPLPPIPPDLAREQVAKEPAPRPGRPTDVQKTMAEAQVLPEPKETDLRGMGEVGLAEEVARARKAYNRSLLALRDYYTSRGTAVKLGWVTSEIEAFDQVPKLQYLTVAEMAGPNLRPIRRIEAADQLYEEGTQYKNYPAMPFPMSNPGKDAYLKKALEKFQTIIEKYPESDKIDDAAFRMGEIYSGWYFNDPTRAVECYERCWTWNPKTEYPALLNTAKLYEEKLSNRTKAVELYNRVLAETSNEEWQKQAAERIKALTGK